MSEYLIHIEKSEEFEDNRLIGNCPSTEFKIQLDNHLGFFDTLLEKPFYIYDDDQWLHTLYVYEKPEKMTHTLQLTLYDNLVKANIAYDSQLNYEEGCTIRDQLLEMSQQLGINIQVNGLSDTILDQAVHWYDNTVMIRHYLGWIAELNAANVFCLPNGDYTFIPLSKEASYVLKDEDVASFEIGDLFTCASVVYDDGVVRFSKGNEEGHTIYLSSDNSYAQSQAHVDTIYEKLVGLTFVSVKQLRCVAIDELGLGELVCYPDYFTMMALKNKIVYYHASYHIQTLEGEMASVNKVLVTERKDPTVRIKRIQTIVDQNQQQLQIIAEKTEGTESEISRLSQTVNDISSEVSSGKFIETSDMGEMYQYIQSLVEQNAENVTMTFVDQLTNLQEEVNLNQANFKRYIRFSGNNIELGDEEGSLEGESYFRTNITNTEIRFSQNGKTIAYISNSKLYITNAEITNSLVIGQFGFYPRANGSLDFKKVG